MTICNKHLDTEHDGKSMHQVGQAQNEQLASWSRLHDLPGKPKGQPNPFVAP